MIQRGFCEGLLAPKRGKRDQGEAAEPDRSFKENKMTLAEELAVQAAKSRAVMPDEFWAIIDENTTRLAREGLAKFCLQKRDMMPAFTLSIAVGEQV